MEKVWENSIYSHLSLIRLCYDIFMNYEARFVITKSGRVLKLDGWKPVREILNRKWTEPLPIEQSEVLNAKIISFSEAQEYADYLDDKLFYPIRVREDLRKTILKFSYNLYKYFISELSKKVDSYGIDDNTIQFKVNDENKYFLFFHCISFYLFLFDLYCRESIAGFIEMFYIMIYEELPKLLYCFNPNYLNEKEIGETLFEIYDAFFRVYSDSHFREDYLDYADNPKEPFQKKEGNSDNVFRPWYYFSRIVYLKFIGLEINELPAWNNYTYKSYGSSFNRSTFENVSFFGENEFLCDAIGVACKMAKKYSEED